MMRVRTTLLDLVSCCLRFVLLWRLCCGSTLPPTALPLTDGKPFEVIWNAPVNKCKQLGVPLDMSAMHAVTTPANVPNQYLTLFYKNRIGQYPYTDQKTLTQHNGGLPQKGNLSANLLKARTDVTRLIPVSSPGLAVIDWEEWLPLYDRKWDSMEVYRNLSINVTLEQKPSLTREQAAAGAKQQFQEAARGFMEETLKLGIDSRGQYLWGFYLYPDCYNYETTDLNYTGSCSETTRGLNDELVWLWNASTALYPSIYLHSSLRGRYEAALFARNQVQEARRVSALPKGPSVAPVYVFTRPVFGDQNTLYLSEVDLVRTIGESAALGAAGTIIWGSSVDFNNKASCEALSVYLNATLNPYIANVTTAAELCSGVLCRGRGRCVRKNYNSSHYLHLIPAELHDEKSRGESTGTGAPSRSQLAEFAGKFTCQCYSGQSCSTKA
ncbi:hyaluronidase PH-20-like [Denticeps clupeoides]|nr:hyaluronidase PH-20-like [Denticeps clupeoides]